jgi:hypothetical protein
MNFSGRRETTFEKAAPNPDAAPGPPVRRRHDIAGCMIPAGVAVLLPKCPVCLAAYIALATGMGISVAAATYLRIVLLIICIASIAYFGSRRARRFLALICTNRSHGKNRLTTQVSQCCQTTCEG